MNSNIGRKSGLVAALSLIALSIFAQTPTSYGILIQQGRAQLEAGNAEMARRTGDTAVRSDPSRWEGYALVGGALMNLKRYEAAADTLTEAIKRAPESKQPALRDLRRQCLLAESGSPAVANTPAPATATSQAEIVLWKSIENSGNLADFRSYLDQYPQGAFAVLAKRHIRETKKEPDSAVAAEIVLWKTIEKSTNLADLQSYLDKYPNGAFAPLAQQHLAEGMEAAAAKKEHQEFRANLPRFAYVRTERPDIAKRYRLILSDGAGEHILLASERAITSPALSPNGNSLAYVSFENGASAIYVQDLQTGMRRLVSADRGINASPSWSPDGQKLALTLGSTNIDVWVLDVEKGALTRITDDPGEDKEAVWTPDGLALYFTSERSGTPQIYRVEFRAPKSPQRITMASDHAAHPGLSPDGSQLVMTSLRDGHYWLAVQNVVTGETRAVCAVERDTAARFGPKGDMLVYSEPSGSHTVIVVTPAGKCEKKILRVDDADLADPTVDYR